MRKEAEAASPQYDGGLGVLADKVRHRTEITGELVRCRLIGGIDVSKGYSDDIRLKVDEIFRY